MTEPRQPQDHKPKTNGTKREPDEFFSFEDADGNTHTMPLATLDVITTKFVRANRRRENTDYFFTCIEALAGTGKQGEEVLDAIDSLPRPDLNRVVEQWAEHIGASLGE